MVRQMRHCSNNLFGLFGGNHSDRYETSEEKAAYYRGRLGGDVASLATSTSEMVGGGGALLTTGWTGVGALISGGVMVHGASVAGLATRDIRMSLENLYNLNSNSNSSDNSPSFPQKFTPPPNKPKLELPHTRQRRKAPWRIAQTRRSKKLFQKRVDTVFK